MAVLGLSTLLGATAVAGPAAWLWSAGGGPNLGARAAALVGALGLLLDAAGVRPLAVHRQVPQLWGHRRGPVLAAARYGVRLGVGPATILTTWTWWAALVIAASHGVVAAVVVMGLYALARTLSTILTGQGVRDGRGMAKRMATVASFAGPARKAGLVVVAVGVLIGLIAG